MWDLIERKDSSEGNVWKFIFTKSDAIVEAVLYRYESFEERTVICFSVQSGCPIGCKFCGTGGHFVRNLTADEIVSQVRSIFYLMEIDPFKCKKLQLMGMSMGEPMLNWPAVKDAIFLLKESGYVNAQYLISTIGVDSEEVLGDIIDFSVKNSKVGLQFSIHKSTNEQRNRLIPYKPKLTLEQISNYGTVWAEMTGRPVYLNYCIDGTNNKDVDADNLMRLFEKESFYFTFSVICAKNESMKAACYRNLDVIQQFSQKFLDAGYNVRVFNPAGQDDIGGGCGQLFAVQKWFKAHQEPIRGGTKELVMLDDASNWTPHMHRGEV